MNETRAEKLLCNKLAAHFGTADTKKLSDIEERYVKKAFQKEGFFFLGGRTGGYYGPYIWRNTETKTYKVELPEGIQEYSVNLLDGFIMKSWLDYLSLSEIGTGGWTDGDGIINCVKSAYDLESESFQVSLLKHEAQHARDLYAVPNLPSADLEYRAKLVELIHNFGDRMSTGFLGTPNILQALSENGYTDVAYTLLLQEKNPSWLFSVNQGATTMWEHWDSIKEDGTFWSDSMNSFNHYAYGAVFDWIFSTVAGIRAVKPAYQEIALEPNPSKELGFADTTFESRSGFIRSYWYYKGDTVYYEFTVPQGVTANLRLPSGYTAVLTGGTYHFAE